MGFVNCIDTYDCSREGSARTRALWLTCCTYPFRQILRGHVRPALISLAKPIPLAHTFDKELIALEDSTKENGHLT